MPSTQYNTKIIIMLLYAHVLYSVTRDVLSECHCDPCCACDRPLRGSDAAGDDAGGRGRAWQPWEGSNAIGGGKRGVPWTEGSNRAIRFKQFRLIR